MNQNQETEIKNGQQLPRKLRNTEFSCSAWRGEQRSKSPSPIHAAEPFRPLQVMKDDELVRKIETGLECGQWLPR